MSEALRFARWCYENPVRWDCCGAYQRVAQDTILTLVEGSARMLDCCRAHCPFCHQIVEVHQKFLTPVSGHEVLHFHLRAARQKKKPS